MRDDEIYVGDIVRVRQWVDMAKEFGIRVDSSTAGRKYRRIPIHNKNTCFSEEMREYCGFSFTVKTKHKAKNHGFWYKFKENSGISGYFVCSEMLEPVDSDEDFEVASDEDIRLLFS